MKHEPVVSVVLLTYNHERYLAQAIESVLGQRTEFGVEVLLTEDCSTDRTREIALDYAARHPGRVRTFLSERNLNTNEVTARAVRAARGEFVAFLDGDDFWISPDKLRLQVDFLRSHPAYSMCFHAVDVLREPGIEPGDSRRPPVGFPGRLELEDLLEYNHVPGCSPLIRRAALDALPEWFTDAEFGDWPLYLLAARHGSVGYLDESLGVYRLHLGGYWAGSDGMTHYPRIIAFFERVGASLPGRVAPLVRELQSKRWMNYTAGLLEYGDPKAARRAMWRSFRMKPFNRRIEGNGVYRLQALMT